MRHHDGQRHELRSFIAGESEHQALVARAACVHAHGDIGRLALNRINDAAGLAVETHGGVVIANVVNHATHQARHIDIGMGGDFTRNDANTGSDQNFARHAAGGVILQNRVQHGVRNLVRHLVRMSFCYGFRRKNMPHLLLH